ncbi:gas vesicle protein [soil metagenome]
MVEILDRVLDKGLVIAGDIKINLANVELLTIHVRLLICSIDKAQEIGLDWWRADPRLSASAARELQAQTAQTALPSDVGQRLERIEQRLSDMTAERPAKKR